jgi:O-antigen ligase
LDKQAAARFSFALMIVLLLVAFAFGGGGIGAAIANLTVQLTALGVLAARHDGFAAFWRESPLALRVLIAASVTLPLIQLVPLPESVWSTLPSRALVSASLAQAGGAGWMPLSVDPLRTLLALTALVTPMAVLFGGWNLPRERLIDLGWIIAGLGVFTVLLGAVQLSGASGDATLFGNGYSRHVLVGTFANRNSAGLFLTFALGLVLLLPTPKPHPMVLPARLVIAALLLLAVALTQSRTALVLALLPALVGAARGVSALARIRKVNSSLARTASVGLGALALVTAVAGTLVVAAPGRIGEALERFEAKDDPRRFIWDDATYTAERYWPVGAGMGTFHEIYQVDESLENLTMRRAGRAHNEYIELTIEAGAAGLALVALWLALVGWLSWKARHSTHRWAAWAASTFLLAIALQSITDYPLRNQTMLALAAYALLLLTRLAGDRMKVKP